MSGPGPSYRNAGPSGRHRARNAARRLPLAEDDTDGQFRFIPPFPPPQGPPPPTRSGGFWGTQPSWQFPKPSALPVPHPSSSTGRADWPSQFEPNLPPRPPPQGADRPPPPTRMQWPPHNVIPDPLPKLLPPVRLPPPTGGGEWPAQFIPNSQPTSPPVTGPPATGGNAERPSQVVPGQQRPLPFPPRATPFTSKAVERPPERKPAAAQPIATAEPLPVPVKAEEPRAVPRASPAESHRAVQLLPKKPDESPAKVADEPVQPEQLVTATSTERPAQIDQTDPTSIEKLQELDQIVKPSVDKPVRSAQPATISPDTAAQHDEPVTPSADKPAQRDQPKPPRVSRPQAASLGGVSKRALRKGFQPEPGVIYKGRGAFSGSMLGDTLESQEAMREQDAKMARQAGEQRAEKVRSKPWMYGEMWPRGESPPPDGSFRRAGTGHRRARK